MIITEDRIKVLKQTYGDVYVITIKEKEKSAAFKSPDRSTMFAYFSLKDDNFLKQAELLLNSCFIEGDSELLSDDKMFLSIANHATEIISLYQTELKKN